MCVDSAGLCEPPCLCAQREGTGLRLVRGGTVSGQRTTPARFLPVRLERGEGRVRCRRRILSTLDTQCSTDRKNFAVRTSPAHVELLGHLVNQQSPLNPESPRGVWEYHEHLIPQSERKPIRVWLEASEND